MKRSKFDTFGRWVLVIYVIASISLPENAPVILRVAAFPAYFITGMALQVAFLRDKHL